MIRVTLFDDKTGNPIVDNNARHMNKMLSQACATVVGYELSFIGGRVPRRTKARLKGFLTISCASFVVDRLEMGWK